MEEGENINVNSLSDRGKASDDKRGKKVDKRRESDESREKSENNWSENESPVHGAYRNETKRCKEEACFTAEQLLKDYPGVFEGTVKLEGQYKLEVIDGATPVVHPLRKVPVALKGKLKEELDCPQSLGIIEQVTEPTHGFQVL